MPELIASCIFVDPGPTRSAFAHLEGYSDGTIIVVSAWYVAFDHVRVWNDLTRLSAHDHERVHHEPRWFVIETIEGEIYAGRGAAQLLATKRVEGKLELAAAVRGQRTVDVTAPWWRDQLCRNERASNDQIRYVVESIFTDRATGKSELPDLGHLEREHCLDAIGGGLAFLAREVRGMLGVKPEPDGRFIRLPDRIRAGLMEIQAREKGASKAKREAKKLGVALPRKAPRKLTKAQQDAANARRADTMAKKKAGLA